MPVQKGKATGLLGKLSDKAKRAAEEHKHDEAVGDEGAGLPAGIEGGVAKLKECKFDIIKEGKQNAGEYYFYAVGIVVEPAQYAGCRTSIMEMLCDTPRSTSRPTQADHLLWVQNQMKLLGADPESLTADQLEATAAALKEAGVYFRFRTWQGKKRKPGEQGYNPQYDGPDAPPPKVNHVWDRAFEYVGGKQEAGGGVQVNEQTRSNRGVDSNPDGAGDNDQQVDNTEEIVDDESSGATTEDTETTTDTPDLAALVSAAEEGSEEAQEELKALALSAGADADTVEGASSWQEVADMIASVGQGAEDNNEQETEWEPSKGDVIQYSPIDPKTKKPFVDPKTKKARKPVECEIVTVNKAKKTVDLKNLADGKTVYKGIAWESLSQS